MFGDFMRLDVAAIPRVTRQVSAENPTGQRGQGARATPTAGDVDLPHAAAAQDLGRGFKVRPFIFVPAGVTATLADIVGAGTITNLFITSNIVTFEDLWLRITWDEDEAPAVDVQLKSFFCLGGKGSSNTVSSLPITVGPVRGCTSLWPMPFRSRARFEIRNAGSNDAGILAYKITYDELDPTSVGDARFSARTVTGVPGGPAAEFTLLEADGVGSVVGVTINWVAHQPRWWGEGEVKVYLGQDEFPSIVDTGTEDYFGGAWGFGRDSTFLPEGPVGERGFSAPFVGAPYIETNEGYDREIVLYRWHMCDPINFHDGVRFAIQVIGIGPDHKYQVREDNLTATTCWYRPGTPNDDRSV